MEYQELIQLFVNIGAFGVFICFFWAALSDLGG